jgi:hypothetical protein
MNQSALLQLSKDDLKKQAESLQELSTAELWIAGGCIVGGIVLGILIRSLWS